MTGRWAVFLSGQGTNAQAAFDLLHEIPISLVVSNKNDCPGIRKARRSGVPVVALPSPIDWDHLDKELRKRKISQIFLLGFMKILPPSFVHRWTGKIWNLHPSLLPLFIGQKAFERNYQAGGEMGATIHEVTAELDAGPIFLQRKIQLAHSNQNQARWCLSVVEQNLVRESFQKLIGRTYCVL